MFDNKSIIYDLTHGLQFSQFGWMLRYSVWAVFNNFLLIDARDRSKISGDQKRLFFAVCIYLLSFFANTPFKRWIRNCLCKELALCYLISMVKIKLRLLEYILQFYFRQKTETEEVSGNWICQDSGTVDAISRDLPIWKRVAFRFTITA